MKSFLLNFCFYLIMLYKRLKDVKNIFNIMNFMKYKFVLLNICFQYSKRTLRIMLELEWVLMFEQMFERCKVSCVRRYFLYSRFLHLTMNRICLYILGSLILNV